MISQGELLELLELLAESDQRWQRLQARCLLRQPPRVRAQLRKGDAAPPPPVGEPGPEVAFDVAATMRPFRLRVERVSEPRAQPAEAPDLAVDDGTALWLKTGDDVQQLRFRTPTDRWIAVVSRLLIPRGLSAGHRLVLTGDGEAAGRACWRLQAQPIFDPPPVRDTDGELMIDQQTGLVVSQEWSRRGALVSSATMTSLQVDGPAQPELFTFTPPRGARVTPGMPVLVPTRYRPAVVVGVLAALAGDAVAKLSRYAGRGHQR